VRLRQETEDPETRRKVNKDVSLLLSNWAGGGRVGG